MLLIFSSLARAQQLQFHYDFRHSIDPAHNSRNFPSLTFEYFKESDTTGAFLLKMQVDFNGEKNSAGKTFLQVSKNLRFWKPKVSLSLNYSGGLGVAPPAYGYYITNAFALGPAYPLQWQGMWLNFGLLYRYNAFPKGSHDAQLNCYFWKGLWQYKL